MYSERTDTRTSGPAVDGLSRDVVGYPLILLATALIGGDAAASAIGATLLVGGAALVLLTGIVLLASDDLLGRAALGYAHGNIDRLGRFATALTGTVVWSGIFVVTLAAA